MWAQLLFLLSKATAIESPNDLNQGRTSYLKKEQQSRFPNHEFSIYSSLHVESAGTYVLFKVEPTLR